MAMHFVHINFPLQRKVKRDNMLDLFSHYKYKAFVVVKMFQGVEFDKIEFYFKALPVGNILIFDGS